MTVDIIDATLTCLLAGTIGYAFLVDRRVRALMAALHALQPAVEAFAEAADRTEDTVARLRADPPPPTVPPMPATAFRSTRDPARVGPRADPNRDDPAIVAGGVRDDLIRRFFHEVQAEAGR